MTYFYGDSATSPLKDNFLDFLRDAVECCVGLLTANEHLRVETTQRNARRRAADAETRRMEALAIGLTESLESTRSASPESPTARLAAALTRSVQEIVRGEVARFKVAIDEEIAKSETGSTRLRLDCNKILFGLLQKHDMPDTTRTLHLRTPDPARYAAQLRGVTPFGFESLLELEIPSSHALAHPVRLERFMERLEMELPDTGNWLTRDLLSRMVRLDKFYLSECDLQDKDALIKLRPSADGTGAGYDIRVHGEPPTVGVVRANEPGQSLADVKVDTAKFVELREKMLAATEDLMGVRRSLVEATLDGRPFREHDSPGELVVRLVKVIAPVVQEIARRSPTPEELILKRVVGNGRREELFVSKAELKQKLEPLPAQAKGLFAPLGIAEAPAAPAPVPAPAAEPAGSAASSPATKPAPAPAASVQEAPNPKELERMRLIVGAQSERRYRYLTRGEPAGTLVLKGKLDKVGEREIAVFEDALSIEHKDRKSTRLSMRQTCALDRYFKPLSLEWKSADEPLDLSAAFDDGKVRAKAMLNGKSEERQFDMGPRTLARYAVLRLVCALDQREGVEFPFDLFEEAELRVINGQSLRCLGKEKLKVGGALKDAMRWRHAAGRRIDQYWVGEGRVLLKARLDNDAVEIVLDEA